MNRRTGCVGGGAAQRAQGSDSPAAPRGRTPSWTRAAEPTPGHRLLGQTPAGPIALQVSEGADAARRPRVGKFGENAGTAGQATGPVSALEPL